jgi:hypothetical protein
MFGGPVARGLSQCGRGDGYNEWNGGSRLIPAGVKALLNQSDDDLADPCDDGQDYRGAHRALWVAEFVAA